MATAWQRFVQYFRSGPTAPGTAARRRSSASSSQRPQEPNPLVDLPLAEFLDKQLDASWRKLLANVHPDGTLPGVVVASPSKAKPDYWYEWTRDSAIVQRNVVQRFVRSPNAEDEQLIREYIEASRVMQHKQTTIGGFLDGGLGDVKYHVNHEPFMGEWGRKQDDGPGSRVITMVEYALWALEHGSPDQVAFVKDVLYPGGEGEDAGVIKGDLEHITRGWKDPGFDLWEEVSGIHFYTVLTLRTSLLDGAKLATKLGDAKSAARYTSIAREMDSTVNRFWSSEKKIVRVTLDHTVGRDSTENAHVGDAEYGKKSELDAAILLAVLHAGRDSGWAHLTTDETAEESATTVLATLRALMDSMGKLYPLNAGRREKKEGVALGRYPEDEYDGVGLSIAHPWYLCTAAAAEYLYLLVEHVSKLPPTSQGILMTPLLRSTLTSILPPLTPALPEINSYLASSSPSFKALLESLVHLGDSFLAVIQTYVGTDGRLDEQIEREGKPRGSAKHEDGGIEDGKKEGPVIGRGAMELTWSHAAMITAILTRQQAYDAVKALA
ncbi:hypothetical protein JCM10212_004306 [Sporobolomyces blumeae]